MTVETTSTYGSFGGRSFPIKVADLVDGNVMPDPPRDTMLALFKAAWIAETEEIWPVLIAGTTMAGRAAVVSTLPLEPTSRVLTEWKGGFPLLALHRTGEATYEEREMEIQNHVATWQLTLILEALSVDDLDRFSALPVWFADLVAHIINARGHLAFESGTQQFGVGKAGLDIVSILSEQHGQASFADQPNAAYYLSGAVTLQTQEHRKIDINQYTDFEGASNSVGIGGPGGILPGVVEGDTTYSDVDI